MNARPMPRERPLVIAHRGASGELPEHTLPAYALAILQGADYIEPDLVITRDGVLVARHDAELSATTDVAAQPAFAGRRRRQAIDGRELDGWFVEDFTLGELRTLRARERFPELRPGSARQDGQFGIVTFAEVLAFLAAVNAARRDAGRAPVGVYPETKHPTHFRQRGLPLEPPLLAEVERGLSGAPLFIQSFEAGNLVALRAQCPHPLVQLVEPDADLDAAALAAIAGYARAIGVHKSAVVHPESGTGSGLVARAHRAGLAVHAWALRAENRFLGARWRRGDDPAAHGDLAGEIAALAAAGVDGLFCDQPGEAVRALAAALASGGVED
jgi:glycerophosphoryl diester phosphodiesterase